MPSVPLANPIKQLAILAIDYKTNYGNTPYQWRTLGRQWWDSSTADLPAEKVRNCYEE
jgi:hypothetical protein